MAVLLDDRVVINLLLDIRVLVARGRGQIVTFVAPAPPTTGIPGPCSSAAAATLAQIANPANTSQTTRFATADKAERISFSRRDN
jgi:hypothetical protein